MIMRNYYDILEIHQNASQDEITSAFRKKAKETHPDIHGGDSRYTSLFQEVSEAYSVLSNPNERKHYDETLNKKQSYHYANDYHGNTSAEDIFKYADNIIKQTKIQAKEYESKALAYALKGICWLVGGIIISYCSYSVTPPGGRYIVTSGAIIWGIIQAIKGFIGYAKIRKALREYEEKVWSAFQDVYGKDFVSQDNVACNTESTDTSYKTETDNYHVDENNENTGNVEMNEADASNDNTKNSEVDNADASDKKQDSKGSKHFNIGLCIIIVLVPLLIAFILSMQTNNLNSCTYSVDEMHDCMVEEFGDYFYSGTISSVYIDDNLVGEYYVFNLLIPEYANELRKANDGPPGTYHKRLTELEDQIEKFILLHKAPKNEHPYAIVIVTTAYENEDWTFEFFVSEDGKKYSQLEP